MIEIPLTTSPEQLFKINLNGELYDFRVILNSRTEQWSLSIYKDNAPLIEGVILVVGVDLLAGLGLQIKNLYVFNLENGDRDPTPIGLGDSFKLILLTDDEIANVQTI